MKARSEILALALPAAVLLAIDWAFWGLRAEQAGWGVNIDGLALLAAFVVALAAGAPRVSSEELRPSLLDAILNRFAIASFGLLAAAVCGAVFAFLRLSLVSVGPELHAAGTGGRSVLVALAFFGAAPLVWFARECLTRVPHEARIALSLGAISLLGSAALHREVPGARLEYLRAAFRTDIAMEPLTLDVRIEPVTLVGAGFEYLAVGNNCVLRPARPDPDRPVSEQSVAVPATSAAGGFALCPALDILEESGRIYGVVAGATPESSPRSKPLFRIVDGRLETDESEKRVAAWRQPRGHKIDAVGSIRAPLGLVADQQVGDGISIVRKASDFERCFIEVYDGTRLLHHQESRFTGTDRKMQACAPVTVTRAPSLGVLNLQIPGSDMSTGSPEPLSASWLDGTKVATISLQDVAAKVNTPKAWRIGALAGISCGALALMVSLFELARLRRLRGFVAAHHQGGGKLTLDDGAILDAEAARDLEIGEVFVRGALPKARLPGYREPAQATAATLEVRLPADINLEWDRAEGRVTFASAIAIAFPLATSALLLVARVFGLGG